ncbi:MAG: 3-deoxy-D-manno-octulosonic acid transferase [Alphaproteobacteria bacterium]|nr:3-deoxy-D-manno-octulosonic acid transferase [Alphaproteobacteria bacterium]
MLSTLYRSLTVLGAPFVRGFLRLRQMRGREDPERLSERLGFPSKPRPEGRVIWCHAASVGEAASLLLLIEKLREVYLSVSFIVTTGTVTAARMVEKRLPEYALHQYVPVDLAPGIERFLKHWQPMLAIWTESELWPNTLETLRKNAIPTILLNARMSEKSFRNWYRVKSFTAEMLSTFRLCLAQTENDKSRFVALGAKPVKCIGNLKYASSPLPCDENELARLRDQTAWRYIWLMASTHPGEEEMALVAHHALHAVQPRALTIIAPRHPSRGDEVAALIDSMNLKCARRSKGDRITDETEVYLADTMGEMGLFYTLSPISVIGGSFAGTGGHNPIEPAQIGSAIIFGPSMYNFSEIEREFVMEEAAIRLESSAEIAPVVDRLWINKDVRQLQAEKARLLAERKRSIVKKIILEIDPFLTRQG